MTLTDEKTGTFGIGGDSQSSGSWASARCASPGTASGATRRSGGGRAGGAPGRRARREPDRHRRLLRPGRLEEIIAEALHPYPEDLVIATKAGLGRSARVVAPTAIRSTSARRARQLRRLRLDAIELYQLHAPDPRGPVPRTRSAPWSSSSGGARSATSGSRTSTRAAVTARGDPRLSRSRTATTSSTATARTCSTRARRGHRVHPLVPAGHGSWPAGAPLTTSPALWRRPQVALAWLLGPLARHAPHPRHG